MKTSLNKQSLLVNTIDENSGDVILNVEGQILINSKEPRNNKCLFWMGILISALMIMAVVYFYLKL